MHAFVIISVGSLNKFCVVKLYAANVADALHDYNSRRFIGPALSVYGMVEDNLTLEWSTDEPERLIREHINKYNGSGGVYRGDTPGHNVLVLGHGFHPGHTAKAEIDLYDPSTDIRTVGRKNYWGKVIGFSPYKYWAIEPTGVIRKMTLADIPESLENK